MKRLTAFITALLMVFACACSGGKDVPAGTESAADTTVTEAITTEEIKKEVRSMQIIPDKKFETGMRLLTQKDHGDNDNFRTFGKHSFYGKKVNLAQTKWRLAQWDSGQDLSECIIESDDKTITDGKWRTFAYEGRQHAGRASGEADQGCRKTSGGTACTR